MFAHFRHGSIVDVVSVERTNIRVDTDTMDKVFSQIIERIKHFVHDRILFPSTEPILFISTIFSDFKFPGRWMNFVVTTLVPTITSNQGWVNVCIQVLYTNMYYAFVYMNKTCNCYFILEIFNLSVHRSYI